MKRLLVGILFILLLCADSVSAAEENEQPGKAQLKLSYTDSYGYIKLTWDRVDNCDGYRIYKREEGGKYSKYYKEVGADTVSFVDKKANDGKTYYYRVRAFKITKDNRYSFGGYSNTVSGFRYCLRGKYYLDQNKVAPNGCELFALAILLKYNGVEVDPLLLCKEIPKEPTPYWENGKRYGGNSIRGFLGDPTNSSGWGVWHAPVADLASKYKKGINDITGAKLDDVLSIVKEGRAVQSWIIINNADEQVYSSSWIDYKTGDDFKWKHDNHSIVIIGYTKDKVIVSDSVVNGIIAYDRKQFEKNYNWMGKQALYY